LIVGRFQPFHFGHLKLIAAAVLADDVERIKIGIGSAQFKNTKENPFSAEERREMIENSLGKISKKYELFEIPDINDNEHWVSHVSEITGKFDFVYTNGELEMRLFKKAGYEVRTTEFFQRKDYCGIEIRRRISEGEEWKHLVPDGTFNVLEKIKGDERIVKIFLREVKRFTC